MRGIFLRTHLRQVALFLSFAAERVNRADGEGGLHGEGGSIAAIDGLDLLGEQTVGYRGHPGGAVALHGAAQDPELAQLPHDLLVEVLIAIRFDHARQEPLPTVRAEVIPNQDLVLLQLRLQVERILPVEGG